MMAGHRVLFAAFLPQVYPKPPILRIHILDLHAQRCADPGKRKHHQRNQCTIAQSCMSAAIDAVQQLPCFGRIKHRRFAGAGLTPDARAARPGRRCPPEGKSGERFRQVKKYAPRFTKVE